MLQKVVKWFAVFATSIVVLVIALYKYTHSGVKVADETKTIFVKKDQIGFKLYSNGAPGQ